MTETKKMVELTRATYDLLSSLKTKIELIVNLNRPRHKIPVSFDQIIRIAIEIKGLNDQLVDLQLEAGL